MKLILASGSPRRRALLEEADYEVEVIVPDASAECGVCADSGPAELVARLAWRKAADVVQRIEEGVVVAADTVAECGGEILGKPRDRDHAASMLHRLAGREHRTWSGVCVWPVPGKEPTVRAVATTLRMDALSADEIEAYLDSGRWEGKAGAFGYQDGPAWLHIVDGSPTNVVGLPMETLSEILAELGERDRITRPGAPDR